MRKGSHHQVPDARLLLLDKPPLEPPEEEVVSETTGLMSHDMATNATAVQARARATWHTVGL
jgi:hypothetical protein